MLKNWNQLGLFIKEQVRKVLRYIEVKFNRNIGDVGFEYFISVKEDYELVCNLYKAQMGEKSSR